MLSEYLKLVRFPLIFTALADPLAGYCLAMPEGAGIRLEAILPVLLASAALYASGMIFNDCADMVRDRTLHPDRPLASGRVAFAPAFVFATALGLVAIVAAQAVNLRTGAAALALALGVLLYNGVTKRNAVLGSITMGALRAGNVLMGTFAALPDAGLPAGVSVAFLGAIFLYVTFLTLLSGLEEPPPRPQTFGALVLLMVASVVAAAAVLPRFHWLSLSLALLLALVLVYKGLEAFREFEPGHVSTLVRIGVLGIIPLDAAAAAGTGDLAAAVTILLFLIPPLAILTGFIRVPGLDRTN